MTKLINADETLNDIFERHCKECVSRKGVKNGKLRVLYDIGDAPCRACLIDDMKTMIEDAPAVDAEPVRHAHWIWKGDEGDSRFMCSECGGKEYVPTCMGKPDIWEYCPNCGARMEEYELERKKPTQEELIRQFGQETVDLYLNSCNEDYACGGGNCIFYKEDGCLWHDAERKENDSERDV